eukprot:gene23589-29819_t
MGTSERDAGTLKDQDEEDLPWQEPAGAGKEDDIQHSLFGEILDWMLAPLLLLWPMSIAITYLVAKSIANQPFDHALEDSVTVLAQQIHEVNGKLAPRLPGSARDILRADDVDSVYFQIVGPNGVYVDGDRELAPPSEDDRVKPGVVQFRNGNMHGTPIRIAYSWVGLEDQGAEDERLALVQVAETLEKRAKLANEIIKGVILPQFIVLPIVLALVWFALARGLSPLALPPVKIHCSILAEDAIKAAVNDYKAKHAEAAARHVSRYLARRGKGLGVRLGVKTTGCSGLAYKLEYVDDTEPEDIVFENHGVKVLIDPKSLAYIDGTELDFVREGLNEGFKFNNPNERDRCGCGESFRV